MAFVGSRSLAYIFCNRFILEFGYISKRHAAGCLPVTSPSLLASGIECTNLAFM